MKPNEQWLWVWLLQSLIKFTNAHMTSTIQEVFRELTWFLNDSRNHITI